MRRFAIKISSALMLSTLLCDLHMIVYYKWNETAQIKTDLFISPSFHYKQTVAWYLYDMTRFIRDAVWVFCFAQVANLVSHRLGKILTVFFFYHLTQFAFYLWDRNSSFFSNIIVYIYMCVAIVYMFIPSKKGGKLFNLEDYS